ncbi:hypothetical protein [Actinoplanes teichomyceticus]|uniref:Uncharacterized protein n=1 Tax=Actinoplanes teichomyceticus TaxID=1867 RepID=A0A561WC64_ACTTI|nr:hypothetical protein [Actinoplanes teichomyceticus]TWG21447.1 hypothetical protein FHX34_103986 [Actinoplanes teichomyceticus]GIF16579.1 hypothetical protein Ate01nite_66110 [Actinoplanes teichomyceticus]
MTRPRSADTDSGLCFRCGGDVPAGRDWCPYCGTPAVVAAPPPPGPPAPAFPGPTLTLGPAAAYARETRPGRRAALLAVAVVGALLLAGGLVAGVTRLTGGGPESAAGDYFDALGDGDAAAALELVATADGFDPARYPLLSDAALARDRWRPRDVRIGRAQRAARDGADVYTVEARYRAGDRTVAQTVVVVRGDGGDYRLRVPFVLVGVDGQRGREVSVNGVRLAPAERVTAAFPGAYEATAAGNTLLAESRVSAVAQANGFSGYGAALRFGVPELAAGAEQDIQRQVRAALDRCATSTRAQPAGCPFGLNVPGTAVTVRWTITAYPAVSVRTDSVMWFGGSAVQLADDGAGRVRWSADYTDYSGTRRSQSGDTAFRINGSAQAASNGIQVRLT